MAAFKPIDWEKFELYVKAGASQKRIAESFGIEPDTLRSRVKEKYGVDYTTYATSLKTTGELLIEAVQFQQALAGNTKMLIWLGKVRLGQKEPDSESGSGKSNITINVNEQLASGLKISSTSVSDEANPSSE